MAPVHGTCSRNVERSDGEVSRNSRRKRRRRRRRRGKGKGWRDVASTLTKPFKICDTVATSAESDKKTSKTRLEVKENMKILKGSDFSRKYQPATLSSASPTLNQTLLQRNQLFLEGKSNLCFQKLSCFKRSSWTVSPKNALVQLNELRPGLQYKIVSKSGPLHAPVFSAGVEVNGFHFEGRGPTKKQAKMRAAELALQSFIQLPNTSQAHTVMGNLDFTADAFLTEFKPSLRDNCNFLHCSKAKLDVFPNVSKNRKTHPFIMDLISLSSPKRQSMDLKHLNPVAVLNKLQPGLRYMCQVERVHCTPVRNFIMVVRLEGKVFEGCGYSKRQAKARAAAAVLQFLHNINLGPEKKLLAFQGTRTKGHLPQFFAESIYRLVREKYSQLTEGESSSSHSRHKVLAGIVMTRGFDLRSAQVVCLATGTKCLDSDRPDEDGCTLRDCHAEVLSRRALLRFFYTQLELLLCKRAEWEEQSIFVADKVPSYRFRLREGVRFHMYVSLSPCGDARLNCPYETTPADCSRRFHYHGRVKVNGGEGTLPVISRRIHHKLDSGSLGRPVCTASMSCTDKIAKWSVVGLQGALLSHLVEPIYLHSLTVGRLSHTGHLGRAINRRLAPVRHLPSVYRRQQLLLGCLSSWDVHPAGKTSNVSVNWSYGEGGLEEVSTTTGRRMESGTPSRICRSSLFSWWLKLEDKLNKPVFGPGCTAVTYSASKKAAGCYQRAVQQFRNALQGAGLGMWPIDKKSH